MEHLWILLSLTAGSLQTVRNATSKTLAQHLQPSTVTLVRFAWALPFVLCYLLVLHVLHIPFGQITVSVILFSLTTAFLQGTANTMLIHLFHRKNFAVAMNFFKTDNVFSAVLGLSLFHQQFSLIGGIAIVLSAIGVIYSSLGAETLRRRSVTALVRDPVVWIGLGSGLLMAVGAFTIKFSNDGFIGGSIVANSAMTLCLTLIFQVVGLGIGTAAVRRQELRFMMHHIPRELLVGASASIASVCWFLAYSLQRIAYVRTVGQIEFVLTLFITHFLFKERLTRSEKIGVIVTVLGIVLLAFAG